MALNYVTLAGSLPQQPQVLPLFSPLVLDFLKALEQGIRQDPALSSDPACAALAFWLRRKHIESFRDVTPSWPQRLGRGLMFHVTPTNIPIMFAYSLIISLLAGNSNVVRISPRVEAAMAPLWQLIGRLWQQPEFALLQNSNALISYGRDKAITDELTDRCDGRIIWGGDDSIREIRKSPLPPQAVELVFADRYSLALFDAPTLAAATDAELSGLAHRFYNDTYDMDQNACSSPKLICWLNAAPDTWEALQKRWWQAVGSAAGKYDLAPIKVSHKYTDLWSFAMDRPEISRIDQYDGQLLYVYSLSSLPDDLSALSGTLGQFFQYTLKDMPEFLAHLGKKVQTISTLGIDPDHLRQAMIDAGVLGGDRIVSVGQAMDMHVRWDGVNMVESLSRIIS